MDQRLLQATVAELHKKFATFYGTKGLFVRVQKYPIRYGQKYVQTVSQL